MTSSSSSDSSGSNKGGATPVEDVLVQLTYIASDASSRAGAAGYIFGSWIDGVNLELQRVDALEQALDSAIDRAKQVEAGE